MAKQQLDFLGVNLGTHDDWDGDMEDIMFIRVEINDPTLRALVSLDVKCNAELATVLFNTVSGVCKIWEVGSVEPDYTIDALTFLDRIKQEANRGTV